MTEAALNRCRQLLWLYFILLIFEGALRKWLLPSLSSLLLLVRDPVAIIALWYGWPYLNQKPWKIWFQSLLIIGVLSFLFAISLGHGDLFVAIYGSRTYLLQLPLMFLFPIVFTTHDVRKICWAFLFFSIPMTILMVLQSNLPSTHILNVAPGGEGTALFDGALGRSRPPGTFSFITGLASFFQLSIASLFIILYTQRLSLYARIFCLLVMIALIVAVPVSISRTLLANYLFVTSALIFALLLSRTRLTSLIYGLFAVVIAVGIATAVPAFQDTSEAFVTRWELAGAASGTVREEVGDIGVAQDQIAKRVLPSLLSPLEHLDSLPFFGYGIGMGSNVGAQTFSGKTGFTLGEGGWEVTLGELGYPLGIAFLLWRTALAYWLFSLSIKSASDKNIMPLVLCGTSLFVLFQGQLAQPTALGFVVLSTGLTFASLRSISTDNTLDTLF